MGAHLYLHKWAPDPRRARRCASPRGEKLLGRPAARALRCAIDRRSARARSPQVSTNDPRPTILRDNPPSPPSDAEPAAPIDLTTCDAEPIHIPGSIQPHGVLLAMTEPDLRVVQTSSNTLELFGIAPRDVLGASLTDLLDAAGLAVVRSAIASSSARRAGALPITVRGRAFDGILHHVHGLAVLELEPAHDALDPSAGPDAPDGFQSLASRYVYRLQEVQSFEDLWPTLATSVAELTGFDRVMIYRFDEHDGSGVVIAEHKQPDQDPFLGLHYPASDIPQQARRLYIRNRLRLIGDAAYQLSPIIPTDNPLTGAPSISATRSCAASRPFTASISATWACAPRCRCR